MPTEVELAADACAGWHNAWLRALGCATERDGDAWRAVDPSPPIYFRAITLREAAPAESLAVAGGAVCDAWARLDLERFGYARHDTEPWFFRPAGASAPVRPTPELEVVRATTPAEIEEFELVSLRGFWREDATIDVGSVHPASILDCPRMTSWIGRVDGRAVSAAMSYRTDEAIGIFGVTTVASARGRGYGTAMTSAALLVETGLPAVLAPSPEAESLYRRLGFRDVGRLQKWFSPGPAP